MKLPSTLRRFALCGLLLLAVLAAAPAVHAAPVTLDLAAAPDPVGRGEAVTYTATIGNTGPTPLADLAFQDPLPTGVDQWRAEYRVDGGPWATYPVSGLIPLAPLPAGGTRRIEVRATVEHSAPGCLANTARVTGPGGPLATATALTNVLPSVDAGADKMVNLRGSVLLSDASAEDGGDEIAAYSWTDNGGGGGFDDPAALHPTYTAPGSSGLLTLTLRATDRQGGSSSDSLRLRVNAFPTAEAGGDRAVDEGGSIALADASGRDSDGWITAVAWDDGGAGGTFSPSPASRNPTYTAPLTSACAGEDVTLTLTVTDDWGAEGKDSLTLHVRNVNAVPVADAGRDMVVRSGEGVTLAGRGDDPDGGSLRFLWELLSGPPLPLSGEGTSTLTFVAPTVSVRTDLHVRLTVRDGCGASGTDEVTVTVDPLPAAGAIALLVQADRRSARPQDRIAYTYTVTNTGETTLSGLSLTDDRVGEIPLGWRTLLPGESATATGSTTVSPADLPGPLVTTVTASARDESGAVVTAAASASVELVAGRSAIEVAIEARDGRGFSLLPFSPLAIGETVTYAVTVRNTGETPVTSLVAIDDPLGRVSLGRDRLDPWETTSGTQERTLTTDDLAGPLEDRVTATALDPAGRTLSASDTVVLFGVRGGAAIDLTMAADRAEAALGETITYTYRIANAGPVALSGLVLTDDRLGAIPLARQLLAPGESLSATAAHTVGAADFPGPLTSAAQVTAAGPAGETVAARAGPIRVSLVESAGGGGALEKGSQEWVILSEVAWAGTPADPADEWIELRNLGTTSIDLTGWSLVWYPKGPEVPDPRLWVRIDLSGMIGPSAIDFSARPPGRPEIAFLRSKEDETSWRVIDTSWWVAGKRGRDGRGIYLLERRHDSTVRDVAADLVYDTKAPYRLDLPDEGAVVLLLNAAGEVVDSANASDPKRTGWPAGDLHSGATMERSDPRRGDEGENWHTNPGILVCGHDSVGNRLAGTPGNPNSPDLTELTLLAAAEALPSQAEGRIDLALGLAARGERPWTSLSAVGTEAAGGGGATSGDVALSTRYTGEGYRLAIDPRGLPPGTYYVWVSGKDGEALLVPIAVGP